MPEASGSGSGTGSSSSSSWSGGWANSYDETASYPGFSELRYYGRDYGGGAGEEEYIAYIGDAFSENPGSATGFFPYAYSGQQHEQSQGRAAWPEATLTSVSGEQRSVKGGDSAAGAGQAAATPRNGDEGKLEATVQSQATMGGGAVEIGRYPSSGGTYIVTRSSFTLPDGRVVLLYNIWFPKEMLWFLGLPAWRELRKQVTVAVSPGEAAEVQARYDRLVCSLAQSLADGDIRSDFAQALEETRQAAKQEARGLVQGAVMSKVAKLGHARRLSGVADDAAKHANEGARLSRVAKRIPDVDATGKFHGHIPRYVPANWSRADMEEAARALEQSIRTRKDELLRLGEEAAHRERIRQEELFLRQLRKKLSGS